MNVYVAMGIVDYEGGSVLGVFASEAEALAFLKGYTAQFNYYGGGYDSYGYVVSTLGGAVLGGEGNIVYVEV